MGFVLEKVVPDSGAVTLITADMSFKGRFMTRPAVVLAAGRPW